MIINYAVRRLLTGLATTARMAWKLYAGCSKHPPADVLITWMK